MPIYEFECQECQATFEELVRMGNNGEGMQCPKCGSASIRKKISTFFGQTKSNDSSCQFADMCPGSHGATPGGGCCGGMCHGH